MRERVSHPPTDRNIMAVLNSVTSGSDTDVLRHILRAHWNPDDYQPATLEKTMKLRYYNGVMNFVRRELERVFDERGELRPMHVESEFEVPGDVMVGNVMERYLLRGVFDRIEGWI